MSNNLPAVSSPDSLSVVLSEEQLDLLIKAHAQMAGANLIAQATQAQMADNQVQAVATAVSTVDVAARMVAGSSSVGQEQLAVLEAMQNHYLGQVYRALTGTNSALVDELHGALTAMRRNGGD
jgi:hypothetical protein